MDSGFFAQCHTNIISDIHMFASADLTRFTSVGSHFLYPPFLHFTSINSADGEVGASQMACMNGCGCGCGWVSGKTPWNLL